MQTSHPESESLSALCATRFVIHVWLSSRTNLSYLFLYVLCSRFLFCLFISSASLVLTFVFLPLCLRTVIFSLSVPSFHPAFPSPPYFSLSLCLVSTPPYSPPPLFPIHQNSAISKFATAVRPVLVLHIDCSKTFPTSVQMLP